MTLRSQVYPTIGACSKIRLTYAVPFQTIASLRQDSKRTRQRPAGKEEKKRWFRTVALARVCGVEEGPIEEDGPHEPSASASCELTLSEAGQPEPTQPNSDVCTRDL